ncbi:hypothetical protein F2P81_012268 [Scophthalmus maximus]|uniref:Uncharacterized protein n=1 Tax=Scophthalmus maximus TaxID=52904 RepID=A0A6A4SRH7_SCOMX|nr:hypothetical protein F2P81_012268 [Scophthalmus maximus]
MHGPSAVAHAHDLLQSQGQMKARAVTDTLTSICCGSKVAAPSVKQPRIYYNGSDMMFRPQSALIRFLKKSPTLTDDSEKTLRLDLVS